MHRSVSIRKYLKLQHLNREIKIIEKSEHFIDKEGIFFWVGPISRHMCFNEFDV